MVRITFNPRFARSNASANCSSGETPATSGLMLTRPSVAESKPHCAGERTAPGANHGDSVDHERRKGHRRVAVKRGLDDKSAARPDQRAGGGEAGGLAARVDGDVESPGERPNVAESTATVSKPSAAAIDWLTSLRTTTVSCAPCSRRTCATSSPSRPAPTTAARVPGSIRTCSTTRQAAAVGSTNTAVTSSSDAGTACRFAAGSERVLG